MINALRTFDGIGIIVSHDRAFSSALSSRTILFDRAADGLTTFEDIPLSLPDALDESERRKKAGRDAYESIRSAISAQQMIVRRLGEKSRSKQRELSKRGISSCRNGA